MEILNALNRFREFIMFKYDSESPMEQILRERPNSALQQIAIGK